MNTGSFRIKLELITSTGILAAILSAMTGWKLAFVWYIIGIICVNIALVTWAVKEARKTHR